MHHMALILAPSYSDQTRQQIEAHLSTIRMRRLSAALEYEIGRQSKLAHESDRIAKRVTAAYATLLKRIEVLEKAERNCIDQLAKCEMLRGELGLVTDLDV